MKRNILGQEAIEFALIGGLVFCVAIGTMLIFGNKIASFFENGSAVAKMGEKSPNVLSSNTPDKFVADYETYAANPEKPATSQAEGTVEVVIGDVVVSSIPEDSIATIKTSGASGYTDIISGSISDLAKKLEDLAKADPDNQELKTLTNKTLLLAETGHIIADSEEWIEAASMKLSTNKNLVMTDIFPENKIQEGGDSFKGNGVLNSDDFLFKYKNEWLIPTLSKNTNTFNQINSEIESIASNQSDEIKAVTDIVQRLSTEIVKISDNVNNTVNNANSSKFDGVEYLNSSVASKTTDLKSDLIEMQVTKEEIIETTNENIAATE